MHLDLAREPQESSGILLRPSLSLSLLPFPPLSSPGAVPACRLVHIGPGSPDGWFGLRDAKHVGRADRGRASGWRSADRKPDVSKPAQGEDVAPENTQIFVYATGGTPRTSLRAGGGVGRKGGEALHWKSTVLVSVILVPAWCLRSIIDEALRRVRPASRPDRDCDDNAVARSLSFPFQPGPATGGPPPPPPPRCRSPSGRRRNAARNCRRKPGSVASSGHSASSCPRLPAPYEVRSKARFST